MNNKSEKILPASYRPIGFSLVRSLKCGPNLTATSLDTLWKIDACIHKNVKPNIFELRKLDTIVIHGVNANKLLKDNWLKGWEFDKAFNFLHSGFKGSETDLEGAISSLCLVFYNASKLPTRDEQFLVTHTTSCPYSDRKLEEIAARAGLKLKSRCLNSHSRW